MAEEMDAEERTALQNIFNSFDVEGTGEIDCSELGKVLEKLGRDPADATEMLKDNESGKLTFDEFVDLMNAAKDNTPGEAPNPQVLEFLRILDEYRLKCENEGNYLEAARATQQLATLRKQEERRQNKALKARQLAERQDVQLAHNMQYAEFNVAWDKYMEEYDQMAQMYIQQMQEKHAIKLREFQEKLHEDLTKRPPKFSRELLDWRQRQLMLAKQKKYAEAEKIKRIADEMERRERQKLDDGRLQAFQQKEAKFRQQQQAELSALLKRIDGRRKEHLKQRALDSKRLLQRNRNVQAVLESKQVVESNRRKQDIKNALAAPREHRSSHDSLSSSSKRSRRRGHK